MNKCSRPSLSLSAWLNWSIRWNLNVNLSIRVNIAPLVVSFENARKKRENLDTWAGLLETHQPEGCCKSNHPVCLLQKVLCHECHTFNLKCCTTVPKMLFLDFSFYQYRKWIAATLIKKACFHCPGRLGSSPCHSLLAPVGGRSVPVSFTGGDGRAHCCLIGGRGVHVPVLSSRFSWHDLFPWQPLPPYIHGHLYFEVIQQKLPRSC